MVTPAQGEYTPFPVALQAAGNGAAASGATGLLFGGVTSVLKASPTPVLWTIATSVQWGLLGGTYWGIRRGILDTRVQQEITPNTYVWASGLSGAVSFAIVGGLTRGRHNVIPGTIMGSLLGTLVKHLLIFGISGVLSEL